MSQEMNQKEPKADEKQRGAGPKPREETCREREPKEDRKTAEIEPETKKDRAQKKKKKIILSPRTVQYFKFPIKNLHF